MNPQPISFTLLTCCLMYLACLSCGAARGENIRISNRQVIESDGMYNGFPSLAQAANGDLVLSYQKGTTHTNASTIVLRRSDDEGKTWGPEVEYFNSSAPDPTLASMSDGKLLVETVKTDRSGAIGAAYSLSSDNGVTWGQFQFFDIPADGAYLFSTRFLDVGGAMYASSYAPKSQSAALWDSEDDGVNWSKLSSIRQTGDSGINETAIESIGPNRFLAISRDYANTNTYGHISDDSGLTWGAQIDYTPQVGVLQLPQLLQLRHALLLFGRQWDQTKFPHEFVVFASYDGGKTFGDRTVLDTYTGLGIDGGYCWPLLRKDGKVLVVYYADSNNILRPDIKSLVLQWDKTPFQRRNKTGDQP